MTNASLTRWIRPGVTTREAIVGLSLIVVALNSHHDTPLLVAMLAAMVVGLLRPDWSVTPHWWLLTAATVLLRSVQRWEGVDDHVILTGYWCLALGLGLMATWPERTIAISGRMLIGLTFAFAVGWKLFSPDFPSGDFFTYALLQDERFEVVATRVGGLSPIEYRANVDALEALGTATPVSSSAPQAAPGRLLTAALVFTWWGIVIEGAVAVAHLIPLPLRRRWLRPATLIAFCATTYAVVPVAGFGVLLVTMEFADEGLARQWRRTLLVLVPALIAYGVLWSVAMR